MMPTLAISDGWKRMPNRLIHRLAPPPLPPSGVNTSSSSTPPATAASAYSAHDALHTAAPALLSNSSGHLAGAAEPSGHCAPSGHVLGTTVPLAGQ